MSTELAVRSTDQRALFQQAVALVGTGFTSVQSTNSSDPAAALRQEFLAAPWVTMAITLGQISICCLCLGLAWGRYVWMTLLCGQALLLILANVIYIIAIGVRCQPLEKVWDMTVAGSCPNASVAVGVTYAHGGKSMKLRHHQQHIWLCLGGC